VTWRLTLGNRCLSTDPVTALVEALARIQSRQPNSASEGDANHLIVSVDHLSRSS
jgi:hypothetical protein